MLTLLGSLLGFGTSLIPSIIDMFKAKEDNKHELAMIAATAEAQAKLQGAKNEGIAVQASADELIAAHKSQASMSRKAGAFLSGLSASVRPVLTYIFCAIFVYIKWSIAELLFNQNGVTIDTLNQILDEQFMSLFAAIISFWFCDRMISKRKS